MYKFLWFDNNTISDLQSQDLSVRNALGKHVPKGSWKITCGKEVSSEQIGLPDIYNCMFNDVPKIISSKYQPIVNFFLEGLLALKPKNDLKYEDKCYSVKVVNRGTDSKDEVKYEEIVRCYKRQNRKLEKLTHRNVLKNLMLLETNDKFYVVRESPINGCMTDLIYLQGFIPEQFAQRYFKQIISAVCYLHKNGIIHGNINCQNVLIDSTNNVKLANIRVGENAFHSKVKVFNSGTLCYKAPELAKSKNNLCRMPILSLSEENLNNLVKRVHKTTFNKYVYSLSDVWSLGVVLFTMLWGHVPFTNEEYNEILLGVYIKPQPNIPSKKGALSISSSAQRLYTKMLVHNLVLRPRPDEVLNDKWTQLDQWDFEQEQRKMFEMGCDNFYTSEFQRYYFPDFRMLPEKFNLPYFRMKNQTSNLLSYGSMHDNSINVEQASRDKGNIDTSKKIEEYYATFSPADVKGTGWINDYNKMVFSLKQNEILRRLSLGIQAPSKQFVACYKPYPSDDNKQRDIICQIIWLQSESFDTDMNQRESSKMMRIHPIVGLIKGGQLYHAVLYKLVAERPCMKEPKYGLLYVQPQMFQGLDKLPTGAAYKGRVPPCETDSHFTAEPERLAEPILGNKLIWEKTKIPLRASGLLELRKRNQKELNYCQAT